MCGKFTVSYLSGPDPVCFGSFGSASIAETVGYVLNTAFAAGVVWGANELFYKLDQDLKYNNAIANASDVEGQPAKADGKKKHYKNPFEGFIDADVIIVDEKGNTIKVPQGN